MSHFRLYGPSEPLRFSQVWFCSELFDTQAHHSRRSHGYPQRINSRSDLVDTGAFPPTAASMNRPVKRHNNTDPPHLYRGVPQGPALGPPPTLRINSQERKQTQRLLLTGRTRGKSINLAGKQQKGEEDQRKAALSRYIRKQARQSTAGSFLLSSPIT